MHRLLLREGRPKGRKEALEKGEGAVKERPGIQFFKEKPYNLPQCCTTHLKASNLGVSGNLWKDVAQAQSRVQGKGVWRMHGYREKGKRGDLGRRNFRGGFCRFFTKSNLSDILYL